MWMRRRRLQKQPTATVSGTVIAMANPDDLLTSAEAAAVLGVKNNTLEIWRHKGKGPPFIKLGNTPQSPVRYLRSVIDQFCEQQTFASTSGYSEAAQRNVKPNNRRSAELSA
jgi:hypothetical protein